MKKQIRILSLLLSIVLIIPLASCQNKKAENPGETTVETTAKTPEKNLLLPALSASLDEKTSELYNILKVLGDAQKTGYEKTVVKNAEISEGKTVSESANTKYSPEKGALTVTEFSTDEGKELTVTEFAGYDSVSYSCPEMFEGTYGTAMKSFRENLDKSVFSEGGELCMNSDFLYDMSRTLFEKSASNSDYIKGISAVINAFADNSDITERTDGEDRVIEYISANDNVKAFFGEISRLYKEDRSVKNLYYSFHSAVITDSIFVDTPEDILSVDKMYEYVVKALAKKADRKKLSDKITVTGTLSGEKLTSLDVRMNTSGNDWGITVKFFDGRIELSLVYPYLQFRHSGLSLSPEKTEYVIFVNRENDLSEYTLCVKAQAEDEDDTEIGRFTYNVKSGEYSMTNLLIEPFKISGNLTLSDGKLEIKCREYDSETDKIKCTYDYSLAVGAENFEIPEYTELFNLTKDEAEKVVKTAKKGFVNAFFKDSFNYFVAKSQFFGLNPSSVDESDPNKDRAESLAKCLRFFILNSDRPAGLIYKSDENFDVNKTYFDMDTVKLIAENSGIKDGSYMLSMYGDIESCKKDKTPETGYMVITFENYVPTFNVAK